MPRSKTVAVQTKTESGFSLETMPFLTEDQFNWIAERMGVESDEAANMRTATDPAVVDMWKQTPDFRYAYDLALENKREAFKFMVTQLNGKALRTINELLGDESVRARVNGLQLLLRAQALLIDKQERVDPDAIGRLIEKLRGPAITVSK